MNRTHRTSMLLPRILLLLGLVVIGQATVLTCFSGLGNTTETKQCGVNELCVTLKHYTVERTVIKTEKGCLAHCTNNLCQDVPNGQGTTRCYKCCAENLCNGGTKPTASQQASVTVSMPTSATTKKPNGNNAGTMQTSGMYLFFLIFLAKIFLMEFL